MARQANKKKSGHDVSRQHMHLHREGKAGHVSRCMALTSLFRRANLVRRIHPVFSRVLILPEEKRHGGLGWQKK